jgi:hypothetical protein
MRIPSLQRVVARVLKHAVLNAVLSGDRELLAGGTADAPQT